MNYLLNITSHLRGFGGLVALHDLLVLGLGSLLKSDNFVLLGFDLSLRFLDIIVQLRPKFVLALGPLQLAFDEINALFDIIFGFELRDLCHHRPHDFINCGFLRNHVQLFQN